MDAA